MDQPFSHNHIITLGVVDKLLVVDFLLSQRGNGKVTGIFLAE
jgi:hypothetical protein